MSDSLSLVLALLHRLILEYSDRPLHRLIEINPKRNQGETFAFLEVVRNKKARKDMHAFTCPDCSDVSHSFFRLFFVHRSKLI